MTQTYFPARPKPQEDMPDERQHRRQLAQQLTTTIQGRIDCTLSLTLTANVASTTITDSRISLSTAVLAMPTTANAAAEIGAGTMYFTPSAGQCVVTHANNAQIDRTFTMALIG